MRYRDVTRSSMGDASSKLLTVCANPMSLLRSCSPKGDRVAPRGLRGDFLSRNRAAAACDEVLRRNETMGSPLVSDMVGGAAEASLSAVQCSKIGILASGLSATVSTALPT